MASERRVWSKSVQRLLGPLCTTECSLRSSPATPGSVRCAPKSARGAFLFTSELSPPSLTPNYSIWGQGYGEQGESARDCLPENQLCGERRRGQGLRQAAAPRHQRVRQARRQIADGDWFYDPAVSGDDAIESRPGFAALLDRTEAEGIRTVLIEDASRFARKLLTQELGIIALAERGMHVVTARRTPQSHTVRYPQPSKPSKLGF